MAEEEDDELRRENSALRSRLAELERALAEVAAIDEQRERVLTIVEASSQAILSTATDGTILSWNRAAERLYGHAPGEAIGRNALELVPFDRLAEHADATARALCGEAVMLETRRRRRDGKHVHITAIYARLADPGGRPIGISIIAHERRS